MIDQTADDVTESRADRNRGKEHGERAPTPLAGEVVRKQRGRDGAVCGFADPDRRARGEQSSVATGEAGERGGEAPNRDAQAQQAIA